MKLLEDILKPAEKMNWNCLQDEQGCIPSYWYRQSQKYPLCANVYVLAKYCLTRNMHKTQAVHMYCEVQVYCDVHILCLHFMP